jgi:hypothetical protein
MELLTFVGQAARRKGDYVDRAEGLAESAGSLEKLEEEMNGRADALSRKLALGKITLSEFQRAAAEDTLVSSLAAVQLGYGRKSGLTDSAYAETMGAMQYLWRFFEDIKRALAEGKIEYGSVGQDFADAEETEDSILDEIPESALSPKPGASIPATWGGVRERVKRYLVTPAYRWHNAGRMARRQELGAKEMRRVARRDKRTCRDCLDYDASGWQPIGSLPVPGTRCRCHDRCRCVLEFR